MMKIEDWQTGLDAWNNVKKQSEIDGELADLIITAITKKIEELKEMNENGE